MKPVELVTYAIRTSSAAGDVVLDPFCGSGTTIVACHQVARRARGVEMSPGYVDVAVRRWQTMTGQDAVLDGDGRTFGEVVAERTGIDAGREQPLASDA